MRIRRIGGEEKLREYEKTFLVEEDEGFLPKIQMFEECKELINCIPLCIYDKTNPEDVEEFNGDDPYDNFRYGLKACQYYLDSGKLDASSEMQRILVLDKLKETGNMTSFYMNMQRLERTEIRRSAPIYRRRSGRYSGRRVI